MELYDQHFWSMEVNTGSLWVERFSWLQTFPPKNSYILKNTKKLCFASKKKFQSAQSSVKKKTFLINWPFFTTNDLFSEILFAISN